MLTIKLKSRPSLNDVKREIIKTQLQEETLYNLMQSIIKTFIELHKYRTSETYKTALRSFMRFRQGLDIRLIDISSDIMVRYEAYLRYMNISTNTISFYMRILRAAYNRAVESGLIEQKYPFKYVYTGVDKTLKRAVSLQTIKQINDLDLSLFPDLDLARDMFIFSFFTRGMSFVDMAYLRKKDLNNGVISYRRRKTGQQLYIKWEPCMQELLDKQKEIDTEYLLPIIRKINKDDRTQYKSASSLINTKLKIIAEMINLPIPLTMYVARHSWANIAKNNNIPISVISEGMGHNSEKTTQIYLSSLDTDIVDNANNVILKLLKKGVGK
ncbi:MAG: site-specific integrase [bacterium]